MAQLEHINRSFAKIKDVPDMVRDMHSKGIVSTDRRGLDAYKRRRSHSEDVKNAISDIDSLKQQVCNLQGTCEDINSLRGELVELKGILMQILKDKGSV